MRTERRPRSGQGLLLALLAALTAPAAALERDARQPVQIEANRFDLDENRGVSIYRGSVKVTQGSVVVTADEVVVFGGRQGAERILMSGAPARFRQDSDSGTANVLAEAQRIEYHLTREQLTLEGAAFLQQGRDEFRSDRITYDTRRGMVRAGTEATAPGTAEAPPGRVQIILHPKAREGGETPP